MSFLTAGNDLGRWTSPQHPQARARSRSGMRTEPAISDIVGCGILRNVFEVFGPLP